MASEILQRAIAHRGERTGIGNAQVSHLLPDPFGVGRKIFRMIREALAGQQLLNHVAAIFDVDTALSEQRLESRRFDIACRTRGGCRRTR